VVQSGAVTAGSRSLTSSGMVFTAPARRPRQGDLELEGARAHGHAVVTLALVQRGLAEHCRRA
jgi:hypothetical protein